MNLSEIRFFKKPATFALPGSIGDVHIVPVSGGADSSCMAVLLKSMFPNQRFEYVFTDTGAEPASLYAALDRLETYLGQPIKRLMPELDLFQLIERYKGYLPGPNSRWCTRELKLKPFQKWIKQFEGVDKHVYVGIRADESTRIAFTIDEVNTVMPFVDMGLQREDIFSILQQTIGVPSFYAVKSRSGCSVCPFQRRSELVGMLQLLPGEFHRGSQYEKLGATDLQRHAEAPPLWKDSGVSTNWLSLPLPREGEEIAGRKPRAISLSLFGRGMFFGAEFFFDGMPGYSEFIWHQRVVSYSPTLHGIQRQLDDRYRHLLATGEVYGMTPEEVRQKARFAIYFVEIDEATFDPDPPKEAGYTWQQGSSYRQLAHITQWGTRALQAEYMKQEARKSAPELTVRAEWIDGSKNALAKIQHETGNVSLSQWYQPEEAEPEMTDEEMVATVPCPLCHI